jgi:hypothetical protein
VPPCIGDLDFSDTIDIQDLALLLSQFGQACDPGPCATDLDMDGDVDLEDLTIFLANFGLRCP